MNDRTILDILDVHDIAGRGIVVTGLIGPAWESAKVGDRITFQASDRQPFVTVIKDMEVFRKGRLNPTDPLSGGILLADNIDVGLVPRGSTIHSYSSSS